MVIIVLLLSFLLNIVNHGNILIGSLNTFLLFLSIYFYLKFSHQKLLFFKPLNFNPLLFVLIGVTPLFIRENNVFILLIAVVFNLIILSYLTTRFKRIFALIIVVYILVASFYASGLIKFPFLFQTNLLIFNDNWINLYITQMKAESQYMPHIMRVMIYNPLVVFYVMLSRVAGFFTLKNFYDTLLIANIYPLIKGFILDLNDWNRSKTLLVFCILLLSLGMLVSRSVEINNTFILLSPFLVYFILRGLNSINKKLYLVLFVISMLVATSP